MEYRTNERNGGNEQPLSTHSEHASKPIWELSTLPQRRGRLKCRPDRSQIILSNQDKDGDQAEGNSGDVHAKEIRIDHFRQHQVIAHLWGLICGPKRRKLRIVDMHAT